MKILNFAPKSKNGSRGPLSPAFPRKKIVAVIPTYKTSATTLTFIHSIRKYHPQITVVIVNDCIPSGSSFYYNFRKIQKLSRTDPGIICLKTPTNLLKAGALNYGINYVMRMQPRPHVIFTSDDDVIINDQTLPKMVNELYSRKRIGAVCSQSLVNNKNTNLLTRLQALEYQGFTATKIADKYFLQGPLVMQGMLTAFRTAAMNTVKGFTPYHLIEDYDITVRLKRKAWRSSIALTAQSWTDVPEDIPTLWRQRVRWGYGGIQVVTANFGYISTVFQDLIGHGLFLALVALIISSWIFLSPNPANHQLIFGIIIVTAIHFTLSQLLNLAVLLSFREKDRLDWFLKLSLIPEFVYSNLISFVVLGCYLYFLYNQTLGFLAKKITALNRIYNFGLHLFKHLGYSTTWGTRVLINPAYAERRLSI